MAPDPDRDNTLILTGCCGGFYRAWDLIPREFIEVGLSPLLSRSVNLKKYFLFVASTLTSGVTGAGITMAIEDPWVILPLVVVSAIISLVLIRLVLADEVKKEKALQDEIGAIRDLEKDRLFLNLRTFMNKSHTWALGDNGRCTDIPDGSRLIELNDGSYLISKPIILDVYFSGKGQGKMKVELNKAKG